MFRVWLVSSIKQGLVRSRLNPVRRVFEHDFAILEPFKQQKDIFVGIGLAIKIRVNGNNSHEMYHVTQSFQEGYDTIAHRAIHPSLSLLLFVH